MLYFNKIKFIVDSKTLSETQRENLLSKIKSSTEMGYMVQVLDAEELSRKMLRMYVKGNSRVLILISRNKVNLNTLSHDAASSLIQRVIDSGVEVKEIYVDTVGTPEKYAAKLKQQFPGIEITVSKKADSLYPIVSAASIVAKVTRDTNLKNWAPSDKIAPHINTKFGSGYPSGLYYDF